MRKKKIVMFLSFLSFLSFSKELRTFRDIRFINDDINISKIEKESKKYIDKEITNKSLSNLLKEANDILQKEGYVTSYVKFKEGNANTGDIVFEVVPGKILDIVLVNEKNEDISNERKLRFAFGKYKDVVLNINSLDEGVENLNVRSSKHSIKILPPDENNESKIVIIEKKQKEHFVDIDVNNNTVREKAVNLNISYEKTNLLNINDSIKVGYILELHKDVLKSNKNIFYLNYTVPYGRFRLDYEGSFSINKEKIKKGVNNEISLKTINLNNALHLNTVLKKNKKYKLELNTGISLENSKTTINGQKIDVSSKNDVNLDLALIYTKNNLTAKALIEHKLKKNTSFTIEGKYDYFKKLSDNVYLKADLELGAKFSKKEVIANRVRGFKEQGLSGKYLAYSRNTIGLGFNNVNKFIDGLNPYVGLDFAASKKGSVVGASIGLNYKVNNFRFNVVYSRGLKVIDKAENVLKFNVGYTF